MSALAAPRPGGFFGERPEPGYFRSFALAFAVHAVLIAILFLGVRLQSHAPDAVSVELWEPPAPPTRVQPPPAPPKVEPEPPKPEPRIEKPEIVEKAQPKPKPAPKKAEPPKRDLELERRMREQLAQEQAASQERQIRELLAKEQAAAQARGLATWVDKIRLKIRGNIPAQVLDDVKGNPEAIFDVTLLPTGDVLTVRKRKSSGHAGYDEAVERAILKSSPLPKPDQPGLFRRDLELKFRPQDR